MRIKLRTVSFATGVALTVLIAASTAPRATAAVQTYTGCLSALNTIYDVAPGDAPAHPPCPRSASLIRLSSGDVTSLIAGTGLSGGGGDGDLSMTLAPSFRLPQTCATSQGAAWNGTTWACASFASEAAFNSLVALLGTPGTINQGSNPVHWTKLKGVPSDFADGTDNVGPSYSAGFGLNLSGTTFNVEPAQVQRRIAESCAAGSSIRAIAQDGAVTCQATGGDGWGLNGTAGTDDSNYLGTSDDRPLNLKVNGQRALRLEPRSESPNIVGGNESNATGPGANGATIAGGGSSTFPNVVNGAFSTVAGGLDNRAQDLFATVAGGRSNLADGGQATIGGGSHNVASGRATVSGGEGNEASGFASMIPGGQFNHANGDYSFAAGFKAHADHQGSFVWGDLTDETISSTGPNQFVVRANGGLHLRGGPLTCLGCVTAGDLANGSVSTDKLADGAVTEGKLGFDPATQLELDSLGQLLSDVGTINDSGNPVDWTKLKNVPNGFADGQDDTGLTSVSTATGLTGSGTGGDPLQVGPSYRMPQSCGSGQVPKWNGMLWSCGNDNEGGGGGVMGHSPAANDISTLDSAGTVGQYTSVTVGADGLGLVSYHDFTNGDLKVSHCANVACTSATTSTLDSAGTVGRYASVTVGADGLGLVSYHDVTNGDLKVAHLSNTFGVPYFRRR